MPAAKKAKSFSSAKSGPLDQKMGPKPVNIGAKFEAKGHSGNKETGFIQKTAKSATGAMMGRAAPGLKTANKGTKGAKAKGAKKAFGVPKGARPF